MTNRTATSTITLGEYLARADAYVVPCYQRGYVWGKHREGEADSVTHMLCTLREHHRSGQDVFVQGITVSERGRSIVIIDGQQRTTFFYLLLQWLTGRRPFELCYEVRPESDRYLRGESIDADLQDIHFMRLTTGRIASELADVDRNDFLRYVRSRVRFLLVAIPEEQALSVFRMMNGQRAVMEPEEVIKAEVLRLASLGTVEGDWQQEWECQELRSRMAREWDSWLRWWQRPDVQQLFQTQRTMGLLVQTAMNSPKPTLEAFRQQHLSGGTRAEAVAAFARLRSVQKRFEDAFNDATVRNRVGAILRLSNDARAFLRAYFAEQSIDDLRRYYLLTFLGMTHREITEHAEANEKYGNMLRALQDEELYFNDPEAAYRLLLRLNIDQSQGEPFDFQAWSERSLEHILPKSTNAGVPLLHSIGNLVLIYKNENSRFSNATFQRKRELYFDPREGIRSRRLLHSVCIFAKPLQWGAEEIRTNYEQTLADMQATYAPYIDEQP